MLDKIKPILNLINTIILTELEVKIGADDGLSLATKLDELLLQTQPENGIAVRDLSIQVDDIALPTAQSPLVGATINVANVDVHFASQFWPRLVPVAKEKLLANLGHLLDKIEVRGLYLSVQLLPNKRLNVAVSFERISIMGGGRSGLDLKDAQILIENFDPKAKDKKKALREAKCTIYKLWVAIHQSFMNRGFDVARPKVPPVVKSLDIALGGGLMTLRARVSVLPVELPVQLAFMPNNNRFGVYLQKVGVWGGRSVVMMGLGFIQSKLPFVTVSGDNILIDPWSKIPIPMECQLDRFEVDGEWFLVSFRKPSNLSELLQVGNPRLQRPKLLADVGANEPQETSVEQVEGVLVGEEGSAESPSAPLAALPPANLPPVP